MNNFENGIEISNLNVKISKQFALKNINLSVPKGSLIGLIGRNSAGKTSLIKTLADCYFIESGDIKISGHNFWDDRASYFRDSAFSFDKLYINEMIKIKKLIKILPKIYPYFKLDFFKEKLDFFNISHDIHVNSLSTGAKRKFSLIFAMSLDPKVLFLDEPTSGIDPVDRVEILDMLMHFLEDSEKTVLLSTHITTDLDRIADYIALMDNGEIKFNMDINTLKDTYRLVQGDNDMLDKIDRSKLIGLRKNSLGFEALTDDMSILGEKVTSRIASIEEIMIHFTQRNRENV